jgi:hypothetical protein
MLIKYEYIFYHPKYSHFFPISFIWHLRVIFVYSLQGKMEKMEGKSRN